MKTINFIFFVFCTRIARRFIIFLKYIKKRTLINKKNF